MTEVVFSFNGSNTIIQCDRNETIRNIINKFGIKLQKDTNNLYYTYSGDSNIL